MIVIEAKLLLWKLLNDLQSYLDAKNLGQEIMPQIFSLNQSDFIAKAYFELSRSWNDESKSIEYIKIAIDKFKKNSDLVMLNMALQYQVHLMNKHDSYPQQEKEKELANHILHEMTQELQNEIEKGYI